METFKKIDWNPALEDIIDDAFITDERMERESAMYKIMRDEFKDPFTDIEQDYANVNIELIKELLAEDPLTDTEEEEKQEIYIQKKNKKKKNSQKTNNKNQDNEMNCKEKKRPYVPGIRKSQFNFPKRSCLTKPQQSMCLRVFTKLLDNKQKGLSKEEQLELESYLAMKDKILEEQKEFLDFTRSKWNDTLNWPIKCNKFIISKWKAKMKKFHQKLPRYYIESKIISLSVQKIDSTLAKSIELKFKSCLHEGSFSKVMWPTFDRPSMLNMSPAILLNKYQCVTPNKVTQHFRLPVSDDTYCENLAIETKADFVISSSGLKCLLNNDLCNSNSWIIPVVIKSHNGKNVVYIDKRMPPSIATIPQKNTWVYKYILRHHFINGNDEMSKEKMRHTKENKATVHPDLDNVESECSAEFNDYLKIYEEDLCLSDSQNLGPHESESLDDLANGDKTNDELNVTYRLFTIGPTEYLNCELKKHDVKKYQMLVRTKTDGIEVLPNGISQYVMLAPKMEHQLEFGAEAVTFEEVSHQWASLICRPETVLARVRITADTSEAIQIEKHTITSLSNEMRRLYNTKIENSLSILHNIIEGLSSLTPGQYIMQHIPQRGPFAYVYKEVKEFGKNVFDLHTICQSEQFQTAAKTPWPLIDTMLTTPAINNFKKMPAMFNVGYQPLANRPRGRPKNIHTDESAPRRSLRLKEAKDK